MIAWLVYHAELQKASDVGEMKSWTIQKNAVTSVAYAPDGLHGLSGSKDNSVRYWSWFFPQNPKTPMEGIHSTACCFEEHGAPVIRVAFFSADRHRALSASSDGVVCLWDVETGSIHHTDGNFHRNCGCVYMRIFYG
jgi:WD40 repeat protein